MVLMRQFKPAQKYGENTFVRVLTNAVFRCFLADFLSKTYILDVFTHIFYQSHLSASVLQDDTAAETCSKM